MRLYDDGIELIFGYLAPLCCYEGATLPTPVVLVRSVAARCFEGQHSQEKPVNNNKKQLVAKFVCFLAQFLELNQDDAEVRGIKNSFRNGRKAPRQFQNCGYFSF